MYTTTWNTKIQAWLLFNFFNCAHQQHISLTFLSTAINSLFEDDFTCNECMDDKQLEEALHGIYKDTSLSALP